MKEIKSEVYQLISKGYTVEQIAEILDESEEKIKKVYSDYIEELVQESEDVSLFTLKRSEYNRIFKSIREFFNFYNNGRYWNRKDVREQMPERLINKIKEDNR
ncbi:MAG: hypothetical protein ACQESM_10445 [Bacteroidota bacterium]